MKRMISYLVFLCLLLTGALFFTACGETPATTDAGTGTVGTTAAPDGTSSSSDTADETEPEDPLPTQPLTITVAGTPLSEYRIVYATSEYRLQANRLLTEYDFYRLTAERIAAEIETITGVKLAVVRDSQAVKEQEILVGPTARREEADLLKDLDIYDYVNTVKNGKLVIGGGRDLTPWSGNLKVSYTWASTYHAFDALQAWIREEVAEGKTTLDLDEGFSANGTRHITTVACIGDSITEGDGSTDWNYNSYPAVLGRLLWQDYVVINYGNCGKTMRNDLGAGWRGTPQYQATRTFGKNFDLALVMLGTNDSAYDRVWNAADDRTYFNAARSIFGTLRSDSKEVRLVVMNCPAYYGSGTSGSAHVRNLQADLPAFLEQQNIGGVMFYDMHGFTAEHVGQANFPDGLHPNNQGYFTMAKGLSEALPAFMDGSWDLAPVKVEELTGEAPAVPIASGAVNLMPQVLDERYPMETYASYYPSWHMPGAPYFFADTARFENTTVTNIEFPVAYGEKGRTFTVRVVRYNHPNVVEVLSTTLLTADFSCGLSWARFAVNIEVPEGCTLAFGDPSDTLPILYFTQPLKGYDFYNTPGEYTGGASLALNVYGIRHKEVEPDTPKDKELAEGSVLLLPQDLEEVSNPAGLSAWYMPGAPYLYLDLTRFEGYRITDIEVPVLSCNAGDVMTLSVIRWNNGIVETLTTVQLKAETAAQREWMLFHGLDLVVPSGCTLAFGSPQDTLFAGYYPGNVPGYEFYNRNAEPSASCLPFNVWGQKDET